MQGAGPSAHKEVADHGPKPACRLNVCLAYNTLYQKSNNLLTFFLSQEIK